MMKNGVDVMATAEGIIKIAKQLEGYKATYGSCIPNNWFYGYNVGGEVAWCAATICYWFNKAGASDLIPVKSANCGVLARGFYDKGQLYTSNYKVGDIVFFHWSGNKSTSVPGVYSLDHVGLIIGINSNGSYTTIEGNTGNSTYGECLIRTRYSNQISCVGRPKYTSAAPALKKTAKPDIYYKIRSNKKWSKEMKNLATAGADGVAITDIAIKVSTGTVQYRVHVAGGEWLPRVTGYSTRDSKNGYAGIGKPIDMVEIYYKTPDSLRKNGKVYGAKYRVSALGTPSYYDWQVDNQRGGKMDGYAGARNKKIDKFQLFLEEL
jgi:hypothetical protein